MKSHTIEHPKTSHKLFKTVRQGKKVVSGKNFLSPLYSKITKCEKCFNEKNAKITKRSHAYKGYTSTYNVENLNSFNPELQRKSTEFAIKNKLKKLLHKSRGFKFVASLVVEFKKIEIDGVTKNYIFYFNSKAETIINESNTKDVFILIYATIMSSILKSLGKGSLWVIDSAIVYNINISKDNPLAGSS